MKKQIKLVPREARVILSLMMLTWSTIANCSNNSRSCVSVICLGTWPTNSFTLSSLCLLPSAIADICMYVCIVCMYYSPGVVKFWVDRFSFLSLDLSLSKTTTSWVFMEKEIEKLTHYLGKLGVLLMLNNFVFFCFFLWIKFKIHKYTTRI